MIYNTHSDNKINQQYATIHRTLRRTRSGPATLWCTNDSSSDRGPSSSPGGRTIQRSCPVRPSSWRSRPVAVHWRILWRTLDRRPARWWFLRRAATRRPCCNPAVGRPWCRYIYTTCEDGGYCFAVQRCRRCTSARQVSGGDQEDPATGPIWHGTDSCPNDGAKPAESSAAAETGREEDGYGPSSGTGCCNWWTGNVRRPATRDYQICGSSPTRRSSPRSAGWRTLWRPRSSSSSDRPSPSSGKTVRRKA